MLLLLLYLKQTHALILTQTFTTTFIKTLKLVKNIYIYIDGIRPHTEKANDGGNCGKVVNALSTKDNP
jgi:hypothetical protein